MLCYIAARAIPFVVRLFPLKAYEIVSSITSYRRENKNNERNQPDQLKPWQHHHASIIKRSKQLREP